MREIRLTPRVCEAFGGLKRAESILVLMWTEFEACSEQGTEALALAAVDGLGAWTVSMIPGTPTSVLVDFKRIQELVWPYENGWLLAHNHPNLVAFPSEEDNMATCRIGHVSELIQCPIVDHWIFGDADTFYSYAESRPSYLQPGVNFCVGKDPE